MTCTLAPEQKLGPDFDTCHAADGAPEHLVRRGHVSCFGDVTQVPQDVLTLVCESLVSRSGDEGLKDAVRLSLTSRGMMMAYRSMLDADVALLLKVEGYIKAATEKRKLARRLTLSAHDVRVKQEIAWLLFAGVMALLLLSVACLAWPHASWSWILSYLINFAVFICTHLLVHTCVVAAGYRTCASKGPWAALILGLTGLVGYYMVIARLIQSITGIQKLPSYLDLEPWGHYKAISATFYPAAVIVWPLFGTTMRWRLLHTVSNTFAWVYGVYEWHHSFGIVKSRNHIK